MPNSPSRPCSLCAKPASAEFRPFCSRGCRDRDLNAWLGEGYRVPVPPAADEGDEPDDTADQSGG